MSLDNLILLTGRTISQGVALEGGKASRENSLELQLKS
jgi:formylmethanofuran dehydrogenase subunit D